MKEIVFFDSGVGGLTVLNTAMEILPNENYLYYADTDNVPYGIKEKEVIKNLVFSAIENLKEEDIKALVLACNTATSVAVEDLRKKYAFPIVGMEPAVKPATELGEKNILVCATDSTLKQRKLKQLILNLQVENRIEMLSLQEMVIFAEHFNFKDRKLDAYLSHQFVGIDWSNYDAVVLGCTHFLFFKDDIRKHIPQHIKILDGNLGTVKRLKSLIEIDTKKQKGQLRFMKSGRNCSLLEFDHFIRYYQENL